MRMHLKASLGWLEGFPLAREGQGDASSSGEALVWFVPGDTSRAISRVDKALLIRAGRTVRELAGEFPEALASVVGDVTTFVAGVTRVVTRARLALRDGLDQPSPFEVDEAFGAEAKKTARALCSRLPVLAPTIRALGFLGLMKPREAERSLARLARDADRYAEATRLLEREAKPNLPYADTHACRVWAMLEVVRRSQPEATAFLEEALLEPASYDVPLSGGANAARALSASLGRLAKRKPGPVPSVSTSRDATLAPTLVHTLEEVIADEPTSRRHVLELFALLEPLEAVRAWKPFYDALEALGARAHALGTSVHAVRRSTPGKDPGSVETSGIAAAVIKVDTLTREAPPDADAKRWLEAALALGRSEHREIASELERLLVLVPTRLDGAWLRGGMAVDVANHLRWDDETEQKTTREFLEAFRKALDARGRDVNAFLAPFVESYANPTAYSGLTSSLLSHLDRPGAAKIFFSVLIEKTQPGRPVVDKKEALSLARVSAFAPDEACATTWLAEIARCASVYVSPEVLSFAATLASGRPECFGPLLGKLSVLDLDTRDTERLRRWLGDGGGHVELVREALLDGHGGLLKSALVRLEALGHAGLDPIEPEPLVEGASPGAFLDFPEELRSAMARVAQLASSPASTLGKLLGPAFRSREDLAQELEALQKKRLVADTAALARREATLIQRIAAPPERHSPEKLARLLEKLELAAKRQRLERWVSALDQRVDTRVVEMLAVPTNDPRLSKESTRECLLAVLKLEAKTRALARTVLARRFGVGPWDLRDHPKNASFVASLEKRGARMAPWLDGIGARKERLPAQDKGRELTLELEADPLEILEMGRHFGTCLSPGAFNYFSVFSNLVDINKRVLYARDGEGRVSGRCLLGLTAEGALVTFHAYRHGTFDFGAMVARFATELASRMGVVVVARGSVPLLVASDWYDDGPVDLGGRLPYLLEGSALRKGLAEVPIEGLEALLEAHLAPLAMNELTLPTLLDLPELDARPELGVGFVSLARTRGLDRLPEHVVLRLAELLHAAGRHDLVDEGWVLAAARRASAGDRGVPDRVLQKLAELFPSGTLALLRETRPKGVRTLADEYQGSRLLAAAEAMRALSREHQALGLYTRALRAGLWGEDRTRCRTRMAKMKRGLRVRRGAR